MKNSLILLFFVYLTLLSGCKCDKVNSTLNPSSNEEVYQNQLTCIYVGGIFDKNIYRCENEEVICYVTYSDKNLNCKFKN